MEGCIAVFITAGEGPIPVELLKPGILDFIGDDVDTNLKSNSEYQVVISQPKPDSFTTLAEKGLFVYDWQDIHRKSSESIHAYDLVVRPTTPVRSDGISDKLAKLAQMICFHDIKFANSISLSPYSYFACMQRD
ncbi:hypothetical protein G6N74_03630 [Mesorhizobium sp. CGMCC 1.15528]|uniref:Uncharacterized protein n=1 Tax=Mesorhizobium zhangyense TaxID=1776730 RepID=A0A7C9V454_9HYPH|nr:hypothetical protein [Mesorhizobium zhangyense]NGN40145.1 hypothetical protein [Mesorhizobium zhangyense]